jgi:hypothetical protein
MATISFFSVAAEEFYFEDRIVGIGASACKRCGRYAAGYGRSQESR